MLRAFLIEPASSRGPYDDTTTVTQGVVVYNLTYDRQETAVRLVRLPESGYPAGDYAAAKRHANEITIVTGMRAAFARLSSSACSDHADVGSIV
jgi:hypothetical protein